MCRVYREITLTQSSREILMPVQTMFGVHKIVINMKKKNEKNNYKVKIFHKLFNHLHIDHSDDYKKLLIS